MQKKILFILILLGNFLRSLYAQPCPVSLFSLGGGYLDAGSNHSGGIFQCEYKFPCYFWNHVRPQASLAFPELYGVFFCFGLAYELYLTKWLVLTPNFCPGLYYKGLSRDLGFPLEFRSCFEVAYEFRNRGRFGLQFYHISNASLSGRNPGVNALTLYLAFPLNY